MARASAGGTAEFNQNRLLRVLQLIRLLRSDRHLSMAELSAAMELGERSVYRYLKLLEEVGFTVLKDAEGGVFVAGEELRDVFTREEALMIHTALHAAFPGDERVAQIASKLDLFEPQQEVASAIAQAGRARVLGRISEAMQAGKRVLLKGYQSANSNTVSNREVEPVEFIGGHTFISAFEVASGNNKYYRLDRIADVEVLDAPISEVAQHEVHAPDVFGFALDLDVASRRVRLEMSLQAALFLKAEVPLVAPHLVAVANRQRMALDVVVADYRPAVRFVLPFVQDGSVEVLGDAGFKEAVEQALGRLREGVD